MWHEARKQERKIRGMLVDYRRRAERRQDFYERIKADPTQFMQIHGRACRIHLDPAVAAAGESAAIIVPWQGQQDNLIDRFDVRAHLDYIPAIVKTDSNEPLSNEERQCNYERYRILAQNDFLGLSEEKFLHQLYLEEQFGANAQFEAEKNVGKKKQSSGATIGYSYDDDSSTPFSHILNIPQVQPTILEGDEDASDSDVDMDVCIDISKLETAQAHELNSCGRNYGMLSNDFYSYLTNDADEAEALRMAREEEHEKMMLSGRKSRRERRAQKERRVAGRPFSPPSYAAKEPVQNEKENESESRSPSPENTGKITYITSFGGEDELQSHSKITINLKGTGGSSVSYAQKVKDNIDKLKKINDENASRKNDDVQRKPKQYLLGRSSSRSRSRSRSHHRDRRRSRSLSRGYRSRRRTSRRRSYSKLRKRSRSRSRLKSRSRSKNRNRLNSRSRAHRRKYSSSSSSSTSIDSKNSLPKTNFLSKDESIITELPSVVPTEFSRLSQSFILNQSPDSHPTTVQLSPKILKSVSPLPVPEPPPVKRYYGRKRDNESSDSKSEDEKDEEETSDHPEDDANDDSNSDHSNAFPTTATSSNSIVTGNGSRKQYKNSTSQGTSCSNSESKGYCGGSGFGKFNPRERLKRKMQILLNKQYKADKKAEIEKTERQLQQQQAREDEMRELALKLRRRQRELRHKYGSPSPSKDSSDEENQKDEQIKKYEQELTQKRKSKSKSKSLNERHQRSRSNCRRSRSCSRSHSRSRRRSSERNKSNYRSIRNKSSRSTSRSRWDDQRRRGRSRERFRSRGDNNHSRSRDYAKTRLDRNYDRNRRYSRSKSRERFNSRRSYSQRDKDRNDSYRNSEKRNIVSNSMHKNNEKDKNRSSKNRIVISAPPKLKKLVDY